MICSTSVATNAQWKRALSCTRNVFVSETNIYSYSVKPEPVIDLSAAQESQQVADNKAKTFVEKFKSRLGIPPEKTAPELTTTTTQTAPVIPTSMPEVPALAPEADLEEVMEKELEEEEAIEVDTKQKTAQKDGSQVNFDFYQLSCAITNHPTGCG